MLWEQQILELSCQEILHVCYCITLYEAILQMGATLEVQKSNEIHFDLLLLLSII